MPSAEGGARPDVVLVGATTLLGRELRRELADRRFPLRDITMMAAADADDTGQIVEFAGEARLVNAFDEDRVRRADLLFLAGTGPGARRALAALRRGRGVAIDLVDTDPSPGDAVVDMDVNPDGVPRERPARIRSPHGVTQILTRVVTAAAARARVASVSATVLMPVSDHGEPGVDELYRQTAGVLSFGDKPTEVFGRQIAFNAVPVALLHRQQGWPDLDRRLAAETATVLGLEDGQVRIRVLQVSVFHGTGMMVSLDLDPFPDRAARGKLFAAAPFDRAPSTPAELGESEAVHVVDLSDRPESMELWIAADLLRAGGAVNGIRIAESLVTGRAVERGNG